MPVLQIGADVYCDSALILKRLEEVAPEPSIFPTGSAGIVGMVTDWADHRVGMWGILSVFPDMLPHAPPEFIKDRTELVPDFAPDRVAVLAPHAQAQLALFAQLVDQAVSDQPFLLGDSFSAADAACYHILWFAKTSPRVFASIEAFPRLLAWMDRIAAFEPGTVQSKPDTYPLDVARAATPVDVGGAPLVNDKWSLGDLVTVGADDYAVERVKGVIVKLTSEEIAVQQVSEELGDIAIHFPRIGFSIESVFGGLA
jgi:glutathione S-transferase